MRTLTADSLAIEIHPDRAAMGAAAARCAADSLRATLARQPSARIIVASAPSQNEMLTCLGAAPDIDWRRVTIFHMDEYAGLSAAHPASFRAYQKQHLLAVVQPRIFHGIRGEAENLDGEISRYSNLLNEGPIDLVCMGIGENGHIAFNDPPVADFADPLLIKRVALDEACRRQQVNDGCFPDLNAVPKEALTLTCPVLMGGKHLVCTVPGPRKAAAVRATVQDPISTACPATILRTHPHAIVFLDEAAAADLRPPQDSA